MAYVFEYALVKQKETNARWEVADISEMTIMDIFNTYREVQVVLSSQFLPNNVHLDIDALRPRLNDYRWTFNEFLIENDNSTLPTTVGDLETETKTARYSDAVQAGYHLEMVHPTADPDVYFPREELKDLLITKDEVDYETMQSHCLVAVNGLYHRTEASVDGLYVRRGGESGLLANDNRVGLLSFANVGQLTTQPIDPSMVFKQADAQKFSRHVHIDFGESMEDRSIMLVLGGYLHINDGVLERVGEGLFRINMHKIPLIQRFYESRGLIDLSTLPYTHHSSNDGMVALEDLESDEFIEAYLALSQSFFVILDKEGLTVEKHALEHTGLPGVLISPFSPIWPAFVGLGLDAVYWSSQDHGQWVLHTNRDLVSNYLFETTGWTDLTAVDDSRITTKPMSFGEATMHEIFTDRVKIKA